MKYLLPGGVGEDKELLFNHAMEIARMGTWRWEISEDLVYWSEGLYRIVGLPVASAPFTFDQFIQRVHPDDREPVARTVQHALDHETAFEFEERVVRPSGDVRTLVTRGEVLRDGVKRPTSVIAVCQDITDWRRTEARLDSARLFETVHRIGASITSELDIERIGQVVTEELKELTGASMGALFHRRPDGQIRALAGLTTKELRQLAVPKRQQLLTSTLERHGVIRSDDITRDPRFAGTPYGVEARADQIAIRSYLAVPVKTPEQLPPRGLFLAHPEPRMFTIRHERLVAGIASWAAIALDNARLYQESQRAVAARDGAIAILSHDLRNPLTAVNNATRMCLERGLEGEESRKLLKTVMRNAEQAGRLVDDLLDVSVIEAGHLQVKPEPMRVHDLLTAIAEDQRPTARSQGISIRCVLKDAQDLEASVDSQRIHQAVGNLLSNAIKFSPSGSKVILRARREGEDIAISVRDQGPGIRGDLVPHLFDRFWQARSERRAGAGLGLAIAKGIIEAHRGSIDVSTEVGKGTTFIIRLPIHRPLTRLKPRYRSIESYRRRRITPASTAAAITKRILFIDDDEAMQELGKAALEDGHLEIDVCGSTRDAIRQLEHHPYHALITDLTMRDPSGDGVTLCRICRDRWPDMTVYALSGDPLACDEAIRAGATVALLKPVDFFALRRQLR